MSDPEEIAAPIQWDIRRDGRRWTGLEMRSRFDYLGEIKLEVHKGQLLFSEEERQALFAMLLENVGMDAAVRLGSLSDWQAAIDVARLASRDPPP